MALLLKNATYIDWQTLEFKSCTIKVEEGINGGIQFVTDDLQPEPTDRTLDCAGKLVTKSFACGHHHVYSALARGMGAPKKSPENFLEILKYVWWTLDKCLDKEIIEASALTTAIYCAKNGVTYAIDHHASPFAVEGSLQTIADAFDKVGVSHLLCYELSDRDGKDSTLKGLEETESYLKNGNPGLVGLHASFTVGNELLENAVRLAEKYDSGIHVHVAEDMLDQERCLKEHGKRVTDRFNEAGVFNFNKTILAHCIHICHSEKEMIKDTPAYIAQCTESNLNNNVGNMDPCSLNEDRIMLGTDGMHSDMLRSAKAAYLVGQSIWGTTPAEHYNRFRNVHRYIEEGNFPGDSDNNLVILNYDSPTEINSDNFHGHFIYGLDSNHIESVISNGHLIVENKKMLTVNEKEILSHSKEMGLKLWEKMQRL
jgi:cytosine/adenosine deaminase-related metal-dependent hydrolase